MLNRLVKAAEEAALPGGDDLEPNIANWPEVVRAVLREMREPTDDVCEAGESVPGGLGFCDEPGDPPTAYEIWQAMIDTILDETDET